MSSTLFQKIHFLSTLVAVAGCSPMTFRVWCNRNDLLPECQSEHGEMKFSRMDIAVVRTVVVLTGQGLPAQAAVDVAMRARKPFEAWWGNDDTPASALETMAIVEESLGKKLTVRFLRRDVSLMAIFSRLDIETAMIVDLSAVAAHVSRQLEVLRPDTIIANHELERLAAKAVARAWVKEE